MIKFGLDHFPTRFSQLVLLNPPPTPRGHKTDRDNPRIHYQPSRLIRKAGKIRRACLDALLVEIAFHYSLNVNAGKVHVFRRYCSKVHNLLHFHNCKRSGFCARDVEVPGCFPENSSAPCMTLWRIGLQRDSSCR